MLLEVNFEGDVADENILPAYQGLQSLHGITRANLIIANYIAEGRVRRRDFDFSPVRFNLIASRPGSFETLFDLSVQAAPIIASIGLGVAGNLVSDLIKIVYARVTGTAEPNSSDVDLLEEKRSGDIAALVEAIEPSIRQGHNIINYGAINITINNSGKGERLSKLTPATKKFVWESIINESTRAKLFSIGSFNANNGTGRAYDLEEGRSIPFELDQEVDRQSVTALLRSISSYAIRRRLGDDLRSAVAIKYTSIDANDGRLKKLRIHKVRAELSDL